MEKAEKRNKIFDLFEFIGLATNDFFILENIEIISEM